MACGCNGVSVTVDDLVQETDRRPQILAFIRHRRLTRKPPREPKKNGRPNKACHGQYKAAPYCPTQRFSTCRPGEIYVRPSQHQQEIGRNLKPVTPSKPGKTNPKGADADGRDQTGPIAIRLPSHGGNLWLENRAARRDDYRQ
jgi:hypothetical protein